MTLQNLQELLMWCTVINILLLCCSAIIIIALPNFIYKIHGKMFNLPEDQIASALYRMLGNYKIIVIVFNVVPWLATYFIS